jgi:hypothetical protein
MMKFDIHKRLRRATHSDYSVRLRLWFGNFLMDHAPELAKSVATAKYFHNYPAMVEEAGFKIESYEIILKDDVLPMMRLIGRVE